MVPSAIQLEALKKLKLVQLIYKGKVSKVVCISFKVEDAHNNAQTSGLPRYVHQGLSRLLKNTPYNAFINAYPHNIDQLQNVINEHRQLFTTVRLLSNSPFIHSFIRLRKKTLA